LIESKPPVRTPGTAPRVFYFFLCLGAGWVLLLLGFPPGASDRLPVFLLGVALALLTGISRARGLVAFAFLFPAAGLLARLWHGTDPSAWAPILLAATAAGWCFRFIYDFESAAAPGRPDRTLSAVLAVWTIATLLALGRAETLWAVLRGLSGRAVNGNGLLDAAAVRESVFSFAALGGGAVFYLILRRSGPALRDRAARAALLGTAASALAALLQAAHWLPSEARGFWARTQRLPGGSADPNSLGLLCGIALVLVLTGRARNARWRAGNVFLLLLLLSGLVVSGSRSGLLVLLFSLAVLLATSRSATAVRRGLAAAATAALLVLALLPAVAAPGTLGGRLAQSFDPNLPMEFRVSARPALWLAAGDLFLDHPIEGAGMGAYQWMLPDLMRRRGRALPMRDNPGSGYVQALAETGIIGFLLTAALAFSLGVEALRRAREGADSVRAGPGIAVAAFVVALAAGSHWLAPDVSFLFFLLAAVVVEPHAPSDRERRAAISLRIAVGGYALASIFGLWSTARPEETFRFAPRIGFHEPEAGPDGPFRWTRARFALWAEAGGSRRIRLANRTPLPGPVTARVTSRGADTLRVALPPGGAADLTLTAPPNRGGAFLFRLDRTFIPRRYGPSDDRRELGVIVEERR
jgi:O-antigen ligase